MKIRNAILTAGCSFLFCASLLQAQQNEQLNASLTPNPDVAYASATTAYAPAASSEASAPDPGPTPAPQAGAASVSTANDDQWHIAVSPYLFFPGVHGTVGAFGRDVGFKASAADLLSHFRFGIMGAAEARRNRLLTSIDLMYMRLGEDNALPFPGLGATSANVTANIFILTPKVGLRLINQEKIKADFLTGFRYWHFSENLSFNPSILGLNFSHSQNWVDPLVGGRIEGALSPKMVVNILGDVGGWGTGSQLEYQVAGLLGYKIKPAMTLQAGYRYMYFDYEKNGGASAIAKTAMSGIIFGLTMNLK